MVEEHVVILIEIAAPHIAIQSRERVVKRLARHSIRYCVSKSYAFSIAFASYSILCRKAI
jgi:hypothetical protein